MTLPHPLATVGYQLVQSQNHTGRYDILCMYVPFIGDGGIDLGPAVEVRAKRRPPRLAGCNSTIAGRVNA